MFLLLEKYIKWASKFRNSFAVVWKYDRESWYTVLWCYGKLYVEQQMRRGKKRVIYYHYNLRGEKITQLLHE